MHYVQPGSGPNLVLLRGASGSTRDFTFDFTGRVSNRYRVPLFDRPGNGYTEPNPEYGGPFDARSDGPEEHARLLHAAARALGLSDEIVLGHSFGGAVAMAWALDHDRAALVVVSGATQPWPGGLGAVWTFAGTSLGGGILAPLITAFAPDALVETALAAIFAPQPAPEGYADYVGAPLSLRRSSFRSNAHQVRMLKSHLAAMPPRYPSLDLPVEILHGTVDDIVPIDVHSEMLARQILGARLTRLQGIGRMPHHVRPDAVDAAIDRAAGRAALRLSGDAPGVLPETKTPCPSPSPATSAAGRSDNGDRSKGVKDPARWMKSRWARAAIRSRSIEGRELKSKLSIVLTDKALATVRQSRSMKTLPLPERLCRPC